MNGWGGKSRVGVLGQVGQVRIGWVGQDRLGMLGKVE